MKEGCLEWAFALLLLPTLLYGEANELTLRQKNAVDTAWLDRIFSTGANSLLGTDGSGVPGLVTVGSGLSLSSLSLTAPVFTGASSVANGSVGVVPQPLAGDEKKYLRADATWTFLPRGTYAGIFVAAGTAAQTIPAGATFTKVTAFTSNGAAREATADAANDRIVLTRAGVYRIAGTFSFTADANNLLWQGAAFVNGVEQANVFFEAFLASGSDVRDVAVMGLVEVPSVPAEVDVRFRHDRMSSADLTVRYANFNVEALLIE